MENAWKMRKTQRGGQKGGGLKQRLKEAMNAQRPELGVRWDKATYFLVSI